LMYMRGVGWPKDYDETLELEPGVKSHAGFTILEKVPVQVDDFTRENRFAILERISENHIRSGLSVPIPFGATAIGAMLMHSQRLRHFTPSEVIFLSAIASQLGISIHHYQA
jgi:GAF domain-containing protein